MKKFIAYKGEQYTVEWFFDSKGKSKALEYYQELEFDRRRKALYLIETLANRGKIFNQEKFRYENDNIFALKPAPDRFLCFFSIGSKIIITNAYEKKSDKMPAKEKEKALKARLDYIERCKKGNYYDQ